MLKLIGALIFLECFLYKNTGFGPAFTVGLTITPDRLVFIVILIAAIWKLSCGELRLCRFGAVECCMLSFAVICTVSAFWIGAGSRVLYYLFDFSYSPFIIFILAKAMPNDREKMEFVTFTILVVGAYLTINGACEYFGLSTLVWPKYILDPQVGIQFGRTRGSFASSEALGAALVVSVLFYALYSTRVKGERAWWAYLMMLVTIGVIYTTNQRSAWLSLGVCLTLLAVVKSEMRRIARIFVGIVLVGYILGVGNHFSLWRSGTLFSQRQQTVSYREVNNLTNLAMGSANPVFGVGYGNFKREWRKYFRPVEGVYDLTDGNHNTLLGLFAEVGLVGLIPYVLILLSMVRVGIRVYTKRDEGERNFALVFLLVTVSYLVGASFSDYRSGPFHNTVLFLIFGSVAAMDRREPGPVAIEIPDGADVRLEGSDALC